MIDYTERLRHLTSVVNTHHVPQDRGVSNSANTFIGSLWKNRVFKTGIVVILPCIIITFAILLSKPSFMVSKDSKNDDKIKWGWVIVIYIVLQAAAFSILFYFNRSLLLGS